MGHAVPGYLFWNAFEIGIYRHRLTWIYNCSWSREIYLKMYYVKQYNFVHKVPVTKTRTFSSLFNLICICRTFLHYIIIPPFCLASKDCTEVKQWWKIHWSISLLNRGELWSSAWFISVYFWICSNLIAKSADISCSFRLDLRASSHFPFQVNRIYISCCQERSD